MNSQVFLRKQILVEYHLSPCHLAGLLDSRILTSKVKGSARCQCGKKETSHARVNRVQNRCVDIVKAIRPDFSVIKVYVRTQYS